MTSQVIKCNNCNIVICELLAFIQNKMQVMDEEGLVRLCNTTFSSEDIEAAKSLLFESITTAKRKISRKRDGKSKRELHDIITLMKEVDPEEVPIFVARELHKLPPVTFDHIDVTRLLKDLLLLQSDYVRLKNVIVSVPAAGRTDKKPVECRSLERSMPQANSGSDNKSQNYENDNEWTLVQRKKLKSRLRGSKGKAMLEPNNRFRAADIHIPLFITNVNKQTSENDIIDYIFSKTQTSVVLKKIKMRKEKNYNAYKILVPHHKLALFLNDNLWPEGVSFRRFVRVANYLCHACYVRANRELARRNVIDAARFEIVEENQTIQEIQAPVPLPLRPAQLLGMFQTHLQLSYRIIDAMLIHPEDAYLMDVSVMHVI
ncbi:hypothetical protein SFRURICE_006374 [Spodoptera frugiperda]|nr:hypothetical protein SFRURICE_006374 [Spodoptera frugiperda]